jgi:phage terminase small subunit
MIPTLVFGGRRMPRDRKPAARRQNHQTRDIGLVVVAGGAADPPEPLAKWLAATRKRWVRYWSAPLAAVADRETDLPALERLFSYYDELECCSRQFRKQRFVEGSTGQPRLNPIADHIRALEPLIRALEDRFGLTPLARLKLGVEFGNAHRSLEDLNRSFDVDDLDDDQGDPRLDDAAAAV